MSSAHIARDALLRLFQRQKIADLDAVLTALECRSRMTAFRRLSAVGYLSSYSHAGRYYTLRDVPEFDAEGLWQQGGVLFSQAGTLKETVAHMVAQAEAGQFHRELQLRLGLRVHNTLADLVENRRVGRERLQGEYLYVSADAERAATQVARRAQIGREPKLAKDERLDPVMVIEVLAEVIHGSVVQLDAEEVASRVVARGVAVTVAQVEEIFRRHGVVKKKAPSRSPRSRR
jgi:hypothetical protein